jgi:hypothetical protein
MFDWLLCKRTGFLINSQRLSMIVWFIPACLYIMMNVLLYANSFQLISSRRRVFSRHLAYRDASDDVMGSKYKPLSIAKEHADQLVPMISLARLAMKSVIVSSFLLGLLINSSPCPAETAFEREVRSSLIELKTNQNELMSDQKSLAARLEQVDFKLNLLFGGAATSVLLLTGISAVGKGLDAIDDIGERIAKDRERSRKDRSEKS